MSMHEVAALISALLVILAAPPYVIDTLKHKTKPERMTWLIFSVLGIIAFVGQVQLGASWSLVFTGMDTLASVSVFVLSIWYGVGGFTRLDKQALVIAAIGVIIAVVAKEPVIAVSGVILADISGTALTIRKAYLQPSTETTISWLFAGTAALFGIISITEFTFSIILFPAYLALANYGVPAAQLASKLRSPKS